MLHQTSRFYSSFQPETVRPALPDSTAPAAAAIAAADDHAPAVSRPVPPAAPPCSAVAPDWPVRCQCPATAASLTPAQRMALVRLNADNGFARSATPNHTAQLHPADHYHASILP